jgi:hypothetical protein
MAVKPVMVAAAMMLMMISGSALGSKAVATSGSTPCQNRSAELATLRGTQAKAPPEAPPSLPPTGTTHLPTKTEVEVPPTPKEKAKANSMKPPPGCFQEAPPGKKSLQVPLPKEGHCTMACPNTSRYRRCTA